MKKVQCLKMCKRIKLLPPEILKVAFDKLDSLLYYLNSEFCTDDADWPKCCYSKLFLGDKTVEWSVLCSLHGRNSRGGWKDKFFSLPRLSLPKIFQMFIFTLKAFTKYLCFTCLNPLISNKLSPLFTS